MQWAIITRKGHHLKVKQCLPLSKIVGDDATSPTAGGAVGVISTAGLTNELINHECFLSETQKNADKDLSRRHVLSCRKINELLGRPLTPGELHKLIEKGTLTNRTLTRQIPSTSARTSHQRGVTATTCTMGVQMEFHQNMATSSIDEIRKPNHPIATTSVPLMLTTVQPTLSPLQPSQTHLPPLQPGSP